jgi:hypothetical protein
MDSGINMHLAVTKLQDSMREAEAARAASAAERPVRKRRLASLANALRPSRRAPALRGGAAMRRHGRSPLEV